MYVALYACMHVNKEASQGKGRRDGEMAFLWRPPGTYAFYSTRA